MFGTHQDARGLSDQDSSEIIQELTAYFEATSERGGGVAMDRPFSSPYFWAGFQVWMPLLVGDEITGLLSDLDVENSCSRSSRAFYPPA